MLMRPTPAQARALIAVREGKVINRFDSSGNVFMVPKGVNAAIVRKLQHKRWIEDAPDQSTRQHVGRHYRQQLTVAGRDALALVEEEAGDRGRADRQP